MMTGMHIVASIEDVLRVAAHYPVFPCNGQKKPLTKNGFFDATQDEAQIRAWWKQHPEALVGVPTGSRTGLIVIDYDPSKASAPVDRWIQDHSSAISSTRTHHTRRDGRHWLYSESREIYASGSDVWLNGIKLVGLDIRAEGGYVIWWPAHGGQVTGEIQGLPPAMLVDRLRIAPANTAPQTGQQMLVSDSNWTAKRDRVIKALAFVDPSDRDQWVKIGQGIHVASAGNEDGFKIWHHWSAGGFTGSVPDTYVNSTDCRYAWSSFNRRLEGKPAIVTLGSLFALAYASGFPRPVKAVADLPDDLGNRFPPFDPSVYEDMPPDLTAEEWSEPETKAKATSESMRKPIDWTALEGLEPPVRQWAVDGWIGRGHVTLLAGPPGSGKTSICQTIGAGVALGKSVIDFVPRPMNVLGWFGEDEEDELWRRQIAISKYLETPMSALRNKFIVQAYPSTDITLCTQSKGNLEQTPMMRELREQIGDYKAELVFLDSVARVYGGNENDRHQVTQFIAWLTWALAPTNAALVLLGHPAKGAGSEFSGSTAWEASVRARLYFGFKMPDDTTPDDEGVEDEDARVLAKRKTNYSQKDLRLVRWADGCMQPRAAVMGERRTQRSAAFLADEAVRVWRRLKAMGLDTGASQSVNYLPKVAARNRMLEGGITEKDLRVGLSEAMKLGRLRVGVIGQYPNRSPKNGLMEV